MMSDDDIRDERSQLRQDDGHDEEGDHSMIYSDASPIIEQKAGGSERKAKIRRIVLLSAVVGAVGLLVVGFVVALVVLLTVMSGKSGCVKASNRFRLPESVLPIEYDISLRPDLRNFKDYSGSVDIAVQVQESTTCVQLHAEYLQIESESIRLKREASSDPEEQEEQEEAFVQLTSMELDEETNLLTLHFDRALEKDGTYRLSMAFSAALRDDMRGFYRSKYFDPVSERDIWIATTHMEPTSARTAFPCFDEPSLKARFNFQFDVSEADSVNKKFLSNMPIASQEVVTAANDEKRLQVRFETTPVMSTYLLAFIIGEFDVIEATGPVSSKPGSPEIPYRVFTPLNLGENGRFALEVTTKATPYFSDFFGIDYMLPKLDLVAIPDFRAGAMENYGLMTFRDSAILVNPETTTIAEKQNVARTISHEITHQWAGNLVTCAWWSHLWLNEGFARFFENMAMEHLWPEWDNWSKFLVNMVTPMMQTDSHASTHSLVMPTNDVNTTQQISNLFDTITYAKGAAVLRMIKSNVGDETFQAWMQKWLSSYEYSIGSTDDLFSLLETITEKSGFSSELKTWTDNAGFPVIHLTSSGSNKYKLSQERFYNVRPEGETEQPLWWIPVTVLDSTGKESSVVFKDKDSAEFSVTAGSKWIKVNRGETGVLRVNYEESMWQSLIDAINAGDQLLDDSLSDRFGLVSDAFALAEAGMTPMSVALDLSLAIQKREQSFYIWSAMMSSMTRVGDLIHYERFAGKYRKFVSDVIADTYATLGWEADDEESDDTKQRRAVVIQAGIQVAQNATIIQDAVKYFRENQDSMPAELRAPVYMAVMMACESDEEYEDMVQRMIDADRRSDPSERNRIMLSLAWVREPHLLRRTLDLTLTDKVRAQDGSKLIAAVAQSGPLGLSMAWNFLREKLDDLIAKFGIRQVNSSLIKSVAGRFVSHSNVAEVKSFFDSRFDISEDSVQAIIDSIIANAEFLARNSDTMQQWLDKHY